jgi:hypothetical protein
MILTGETESLGEQPIRSQRHFVDMVLHDKRETTNPPPEPWHGTELS